MKPYRVMAVMVRHFYNFRHNWDRISDNFYWPAIDILLWGLTSQYLLKVGQLPNIALILLTGLVYWQIVWRSQYEITTNLLEEMWSRNMVNFFASPLTVGEWIVGVVLLGVAKMAVSVGFASLLAFLLYAVNVYTVGFMFVPYMVLLLMMGWFVGFLVAGVIVSFGTRVQTLAWAGVYLLAPFTGIFYPIAILPDWAQQVARFVPASYVFEGMRKFLTDGTVSWGSLLTSFGLNVVYLLLAISLFVYLFNRRKKYGLSRLE